MKKRKHRSGPGHDVPAPGEAAHGEAAHGEGAHGERAHGEVAQGAPFDPTALPDDATPLHEHQRSRAAPAPQSPLSDDEMKRLKSRALTEPPPAAPPGQTDPATKKRGG